MNDWNGENEERASTELSGEADSNAVLFPIPILLLRDASVPKEFVSLQGLMPQDCARITDYAEVILVNPSTRSLPADHLEVIRSRAERARRKLNLTLSGVESGKGRFPKT